MGWFLLHLFLHHRALELVCGLSVSVFSIGGFLLLRYLLLCSVSEVVIGL